MRRKHFEDRGYFSLCPREKREDRAVLVLVQSQTCDLIFPSIHAADIANQSLKLFLLSLELFLNWTPHTRNNYQSELS